MILATELTISWNGIQDVDDTKSVGQLIPLVLSVGGFVHLLLAASRHHLFSRKEPEILREPVSELGPAIWSEPVEQDPYNLVVCAASHGHKKKHWYKKERRSIDDAAQRYQHKAESAGAAEKPVQKPVGTVDLRQ